MPGRRAPPTTGDAGRMSERGGGQRRVGVAGARVHDHPGGLVDDEHVVVLVHDRERDRLRPQRVRRLRRHLDLHVLPALQTVRGLAGDAVDTDDPGVDQGLQPRARHLGDVRGQPSIQALTRGGRTDGELHPRPRARGSSGARTEEQADREEDHPDADRGIRDVEGGPVVAAQVESRRSPRPRRTGPGR